MYEIKSELYTVYSKGEVEVSTFYNGYKKVKTIYGNVIREITSTGNRILYKIINIDEYSKNELEKMFKHDNKNIIFTDLVTGKIYTNMFIDLEEITFKELRDASVSNLPLIYECEIILSSGG